MCDSDSFHFSVQISIPTESSMPHEGNKHTKPRSINVTTTKSSQGQQTHKNIRNINLTITNQQPTKATNTQKQRNMNVTITNQ